MLSRSLCGWKRRRREMKLRARACRVSLDYSDGLCTTHGSHSKAGSEVGLDTYGKTSTENTNPSVYQDLFPLGHSFVSRQGVEMAHHGESHVLGQGDLSPAVPRACLFLCQSCSWLPDTMRVSNRGTEPHPGAVGPGGDVLGPLGCLCMVSGVCRGSLCGAGVCCGNAQPWLGSTVLHPATAQH